MVLTWGPGSLAERISRGIQGREGESASVRIPGRQDLRATDSSPDEQDAIIGLADGSQAGSIEVRVEPFGKPLKSDTKTVRLPVLDLEIASVGH
jgi:hypothetical protein